MVRLSDVEHDFGFQAPGGGPDLEAGKRGGFDARWRLLDDAAAGAHA
jgi:hypothetical protein